MSNIHLEISKYCKLAVNSAVQSYKPINLPPTQIQLSASELFENELKKQILNLELVEEKIAHFSLMDTIGRRNVFIEAFRNDKQLKAGIDAFEDLVENYMEDLTQGFEQAWESRRVHLSEQAIQIERQVQSLNLEFQETKAGDAPKILGIFKRVVRIFKR